MNNPTRMNTSSKKTPAIQVDLETRQLSKMWLPVQDDGSADEMQQRTKSAVETRDSGHRAAETTCETHASPTYSSGSKLLIRKENELCTISHL